MQKIVAEISLRKIEENAWYWKRRTGAKLCAVLKDDAYGHGAAETARALEEAADCFAVANAFEAAALSAVTDKDVLVLTPPASVSEAEEIFLCGGIACADGEESAADIVKAANALKKANGKSLALKKARVHLKTNTGMNRYGCDGEELLRACRLLKGESGVRVEGIYSHLAGVKNFENAERQRRLFLQQCAAAKEYFPDLIRHLSATAGACAGKEYYFDMVRIGIGLYGYLPDGVTENIPVEPAMRVYAEAVRCRRYDFGVLGYGDRKEAKKTIHVIGAGYGSGFFRREENGMAGGKNSGAPCMDATIRYGKRRRGDRVCVLDDADDAAKEAGTISYEVLCAVGKNAERIYI